MVAESTPTGGILGRGDRVWNTWFVNLFSWSYAKNIKAISLINEDWERFDFPGVYWRDARLQNNARVSEAWFLETRKPRYLLSSPTLYDELGYSP